MKKLIIILCSLLAALLISCSGENESGVSSTASQGEISDESISVSKSVSETEDSEASSQKAEESSENISEESSSSEEISDISAEESSSEAEESLEESSEAASEEISEDISEDISEETSEETSEEYNSIIPEKFKDLQTAIIFNKKIQNDMRFKVSTTSGVYINYYTDQKRIYASTNMLFTPLSFINDGENSYMLNDEAKTYLEIEAPTIFTSFLDFNQYEYVESGSDSNGSFDAFQDASGVYYTFYHKDGEITRIVYQGTVYTVEALDGDISEAIFELPEDYVFAS